MHWRNGEHGYGAVTKVLHWGTVVLLLAQFTVGYLVDVDGSGRGRGRGRGEESGRGRGRGGDSESYRLLDGDVGLLEVHVLLAVTILVVAMARVAWRSTTPLPPWSSRLGARDRTVLARVERMLLTLLFVIPGTGLAMVVAGDDDLLWIHVTAHVAFYAALAVHVGVVVRRRVVGRMLRPSAR